MIDTRSTEGRLALVGLVAMLVLAFFCYRPALTGAFQLDDASNLGDLSWVEDFSTGMDYALDGEAGPLGRGIALATFAMQAEHWDQNPTAFLNVNLAIHLINAVLVAWLALQLGRLTLTAPRAQTLAVLVGGLWVLMPLLATSSLLIVQRMTTLSALFVLLGTNGYLWARQSLDQDRNNALIRMSAVLVIATVLASLCKESGLLLPVYVLVLEVTILSAPSSLSARDWTRWRAVFLAVPLALLVGYLATRASYADETIARRGFTGAERLLTQAQLLWLYLYKAVVGLPDTLGVYQSDVAVSRSLWQPLTLMAVVSWLALGVGAVIWRRRYPLAAMAVLWFLAGHLLESTVVPLELYFEHRNYLPIIGPLLALVGFAMRSRHWQAGVAVASLFICLNAFWLYGFASIWGQPSQAARHWAMVYPDSVRAVGRLASYQLAEEGPIRALNTLDQFATQYPQHAYLRLQELNLVCRFTDGSAADALMRQLHSELPSVGFTYSAGRNLSQLAEGAIRGQCPMLDRQALTDLAMRLRSNPLYVNDRLYGQFHEKLLASFAMQAGDVSAALAHLEIAMAYRGSSELNGLMVTALVAVGRFDEANAFIHRAAGDAPRNPLRAWRWHRELDKLQNYVDVVKAANDG